VDTIKWSDFATTSTDAAMLLSFLGRADAPLPIMNELSTVFSPQTLASRRMPPPARAWLARANMDAKKKAPRSLRVPISVTPANLVPPPANDTSAPLVTRFLDLAELADTPLVVRNTGKEPVTAAFTLYGVPTQGPQLAAPELAPLKVVRTVYNKKGEEISGSKDPIRVNDVLYVVLTASFKSEAVLLVDLLPASFEIMSKDIFATPDRGQVPSLPQAPQGRLRWAEARDDRFVAIVAPGGTENEFRRARRRNDDQEVSDITVGYSVRVTTAGEFAFPPAHAEDLRNPENSAQTDVERIAIAPAP
jgi:uncharacterized protein YfaS (alpha-2-macroglobulin family)